MHTVDAWLITIQSRDNLCINHIIETDDQIDTPEKLLETILESIAIEF